MSSEFLAPKSNIDSESEKPAMITIPEGMVSAEQQARIDAARVTAEPVIDVNAQVIAQQRVLNGQAEFARISAEVVEAARTARQASSLEEQ
jgi:hypothetical protein